VLHGHLVYALQHGLTYGQSCGYDAKQQLLSLVFAIVVGGKSVKNWGWFMQWLHK
jgi:acid phosphatase family membrane protein YuiD